MRIFCRRKKKKEKKQQENGPLAEKEKEKKEDMTQSKTTKQKNKRGDRKGDSNDSPEIPDREGEHGGGGDIRQPRTPLGDWGRGAGGRE